MATRSTIAVKIADDMFVQVYAHWDGYLEHNGLILFKHYNTWAKVALLVAGGDISSLAPRIFPTGRRDECTHSFDKPEEGVTVYYTRDRGEKAHPHIFNSYEEFRSQGLSEEYDYYFDGEAWWVSSDETGSMKPLFTMLANKGVEL